MDAAPSRLTVLSTVDSTMDEARRRLQAGDAPPFWIQALAQDGGRGRRGRAWDSLSGNVFLTGAFAMQRPMAEEAQLSFAGALAVADLIDAYADPARVALKWPNDVLLHGRKVSGVLLESEIGGDGATLLVGMGVNVASAPEGAAAIGAHGRPDLPTPSAEDAGRALAKAFETWRACWLAHGFSPLREAWLSRVYGLGTEVTVRGVSRELVGVFEDLADDGALVLRVGGVRERIRAGEVYFDDAGGTR